MTTRAWGPEEALLLRCCVAALADAPGDGPAPVLVDRPVAWDAFLRLAERHAVVPLVYRSLKAAGTPPDPARGDPDLGDLERRFRSIAVANLHATEELVALVDELQRRDLAVVALKGPVLARSAYGDVSARQFDDLDVLVRPSDAAAAAAVLAGRGFFPIGPGAGTFGSGDLTAWLQRHYHQTFVRDADRMSVEVHWRPTPPYFPFHADVEAWLRRPETIALGRGTVPGLSVEDQLLFLCAHGCKHVWERLSWVCDVAALVRRHPDVDWRGLDDAAARIGARRMLALGIALAHDLLGMRVPEGLERAVRDDPQVPRLVALVVTDLFRTPENGRSHSIPLFLLRARERPGDRLHLFVRLLAGAVASVPHAFARRPVDGGRTAP